MLSAQQVRNLSTIRTTLKEMLSDRGYDVSSIGDVNRAAQEAITRKEFEFMVTPKNRPDELYVLFPEGKVKVNTIRQCVTDLRNANASKALIVGDDGITEQAESCIKEVATLFDIEFFEAATLMINITKHVDAYRHEVLSEAGKQSLLQNYKIVETQLPRILVTDPMAKYHGVKKGQIVKIHRGHVKYYRLADDKVD